MSQALTEKQLEQIKLLGEQAQEKILEAQQQEQQKPRPSFIQEGMEEQVKSEAFDVSKKVTGLVAGLSEGDNAENSDENDPMTVAGVYNELDKMFQNCFNSGEKQDFDPSELMSKSSDNTDQIKNMLASVPELENGSDDENLEASMGMSTGTMASNDDAMDQGVVSKLSIGLDSFKNSPSPKPSGGSSKDEDEDEQKAKEKANAKDDKEMKEGAQQAVVEGGKAYLTGDVESAKKAMEGGKKALDAYQRKQERNKDQNQDSPENMMSLKPKPQ